MTQFAVSLWLICFYVWCFLLFYLLFSILQIHSNVSMYGFPVQDSVYFLDLRVLSLKSTGEFSAIVSLNVYSSLFFFLFPFCNTL